MTFQPASQCPPNDNNSAAVETDRQSQDASRSRKQRIVKSTSITASSVDQSRQTLASGFLTNPATHPGNRRAQGVNEEHSAAPTTGLSQPHDFSDYMGESQPPIEDRRRRPKKQTSKNGNSEAKRFQSSAPKTEDVPEGVRVEAKTTRSRSQRASRNRALGTRTKSLQNCPSPTYPENNVVMGHDGIVLRSQPQADQMDTTRVEPDGYLALEYPEPPLRGSPKRPDPDISLVPNELERNFISDAPETRSVRRSARLVNRINLAVSTDSGILVSNETLANVETVTPVSNGPVASFRRSDRRFKSAGISDEQLNISEEDICGKPTNISDGSQKQNLTLSEALDATARAAPHPLIMQSRQPLDQTSPAHTPTLILHTSHASTLDPRSLHFNPAPATDTMPSKKNKRAKAAKTLEDELEGLSLGNELLKQPKTKGRGEKPAKPMKGNQPSSKRSAPPRRNIMEKPLVSREYTANAERRPQFAGNWRPLLIILDLNGTLLKRKYKGGHKHKPRPGLFPFLKYIFANHKVMVWSSARQENVIPMCRDIFTEQQYEDLLGIWSRESLKLSDEAFDAHCQVYKQLTWVWGAEYIQMAHPQFSEGEEWDQTNTVLIDDSSLKAVSEPFNLIEVPEFRGTEAEKEEEVLHEVRAYLSALGYQRDVSAFIRERPFSSAATKALG